MISTVCLMVFASIASATDLWRQKIYNWTTYTGIGVAFGLSGLATLLERNQLSEIGIGQCASGFVACGVIMLICFVLFQIGGGDVKLMAMIGAFLGVDKGIETLLWTFVLGGAAAVVILIWKIGLVKLSGRVIQQLMCKMGFGKWDSLTVQERQQLQLPLFLAPSALIAVIVVRFSLVQWLATAI